MEAEELDRARGESLIPVAEGRSFSVGRICHLVISIGRRCHRTEQKRWVCIFIFYAISSFMCSPFLKFLSVNQNLV